MTAMTPLRAVALGLLASAAHAAAAQEVTLRLHQMPPMQAAIPALVTGRWTPMLAQLKAPPCDTFSSYSLSIAPLFLLMGQFATSGGMSQALFRAAAA